MKKFVFSSLIFAIAAAVSAEPGAPPPVHPVIFKALADRVSFSFPEVDERRPTQPTAQTTDHLYSVWYHYDYLLKENFQGEILASSTAPLLLRRRVRNGLTATMLSSYVNHIPMSLRPDDVWLSIVATFAGYVATHSEEMREFFVDFKGKKEISVSSKKGMSSMESSDWTAVFDVLADRANHKLKSNLADWSTPGFTTTTDTDRTVSRLLLLSGMQQYFEYTIYSASGLSRVTLEGQLSDWQEIRSRAEKLRSLGDGLKQWADVLIPVLDQFVLAYQGQVDPEFWQRIVSDDFRGSGSIRFGGWFLAFVPFDAKGKYHLNPPAKIAATRNYGDVESIKFPDSTVQFPLSFVDSSGSTHYLNVYAGLSAAKYNADTNDLSPSVNWAVVKPEVR